MRQVRARDLRVGDKVVRRLERGGGGEVVDLLRSGGVEARGVVLKVAWPGGRGDGVVGYVVLDVWDAWGRRLGNYHLRPKADDTITVE